MRRALDRIFVHAPSAMKKTKVYRASGLMTDKSGCAFLQACASKVHLFGADHLGSELSLKPQC